MRWGCKRPIRISSHLVKPENPDDPAVADVIADWKKTPGTVGIRIIMTKESKRGPDDPGFDRILRAAARKSISRQRPSGAISTPAPR